MFADGRPLDKSELLTCSADTANWNCGVLEVRNGYQTTCMTHGVVLVWRLSWCLVIYLIRYVPFPSRSDLLVNICLVDCLSRRKMSSSLNPQWERL
jgi:hypothetical protein